MQLADRSEPESDNEENESHEHEKFILGVKYDSTSLLKPTRYLIEEDPE